MPLDLCLWDWMKSEVCKTEEDTWYKLLSRIMDVADCIKKREYQLRQTKCDLCTWCAKCIKVGSAIFKHLLWIVTNLSFNHYIKIKIKLTVRNSSLFIIIHNASVFADSNSSISLTTENRTHVHKSFLSSQRLVLVHLLNHPAYFGIERIVNIDEMRQASLLSQ